MDISEVDAVGPYNPLYDINSLRAHRHPKTTTTNTVGTPIHPVQTEDPVDPYLVTSNTGPAGSGHSASPGKNAQYALALFRELQAYNMSEILSAMDPSSSSASQSLTDTFLNIGNMLSQSAKQSDMGSVLYYLDAQNGLQDAHAAEGLGLDEFRREDGGFDMASALAELTLVREGERSDAAREKEATYLDNALALKNSGQWAELEKSFRQTVGQAALYRTAQQSPEFAAAYAANPNQAVLDNLHPLTNNLFNSGIAYENGIVSALF